MRLLFVVISVLFWGLLILGMRQTFAADSGTIVDPTSVFYGAWTVLQPLVVLFFSVIGPPLVLVLARKIIAVLNVTDVNKQAELERQLRDALHASAENAVAYARARLVANGGKLATGVILKEAANYVRSKNPGTLSDLNVDDDGLRDILLSKLGKLPT